MKMSSLKGKAIDIIRTFSKDEFKRFESFAESPYFNSNKSIVRLVKELKKYYPEFNSVKMAEELIYEKVFGKGKYSYSVMKNLMSELILICDMFLIHNRVNTDLNLFGGNSIELLTEYRERKLDNLFNIRSEKFDQELMKHTIENTESYVLSYKLEILKYQYLLDKHKHNKLIWNGFLKRASYELCNIFMLLYTTSDTLLQSAELLGGESKDSIMIKFLKHLNLEEFIKDFKTEDSEENFFVNFYSKLILLSLNDKKDISENYYFEIKKSFMQKLKLFANAHKYDILKSLRSYSITRMQTGRKIFINELFEIDKLLFEKVDYSKARIKWYIGEIFSEIVILSVHKKEYKYAENFIQKYKDKLNKEIKQQETAWTKALLSLEYGNYEDAVELLSTIKPANTLMKISTKNLYLRAYYELGFDVEAFSILDAYKHYVNKEEKFSEFKKKYHNAHHSIFLRLFKIKSEPRKYSGHDIQKLREDMDKFYFLAGKDWYSEKINELEKLVG